MGTGGCALGTTSALFEVAAAGAATFGPTAADGGWKIGFFAGATGCGNARLGVPAPPFADELQPFAPCPSEAPVLSWEANICETRFALRTDYRISPIQVSYRA